MTDVIMTTTKDAVLKAMRTADRPLSVTEIRQRIRADNGLRVHRSTVSSALKRLALQSDAAYNLSDDGTTQMWFAIPESV